MSRVAHLTGALLGWTLWTSAATAGAPLLDQVATCTGRVSALLEQHREIDDPRAAETQKVHAHMTDLLFALITPETNRYGRDLRRDARLSFRALLQRLPRNAQASKAGRLAQDKALRDISVCASLVLTPDEVRDWLSAGPSSLTKPNGAEANNEQMSTRLQLK